MRRRSERGSIFTVLLAGVGLAGVLSVSVYNMMTGPLSTSMRVGAKTQAEGQMAAISKIIIVNAVNGASHGDCDADDYIEPPQWRAPVNASKAPAGGGLVPDTIGAPLTDPWGMQYGYCVWDIGASRMAAGCGGAGANRLEGTTAPGSGAESTRTVIAVISAGEDRKFDTTCADYVDGTTPVISSAGDDLVLTHSYSQASTAVSSWWAIKDGEPGTAKIEKNLELVDGANSSGILQASSFTASGRVTAGDGVKLGDSVSDGACTTQTAGLMRYVPDGGGGGGGGGGGSTPTLTGADIGFYHSTPGTSGEAGGVYTLTSDSADIWGGGDHFRFAYMEISGDVTITARVATLTGVTSEWTKAGVMIRDDLTSGSIHMTSYLTESHGTRAVWRVDADNVTSDSVDTTAYHAENANTTPVWVRMTREGDVLSAYHSTDGNTWTMLEQQTIPMSGSVFAGLALASHDNGDAVTATFDNVTIDDGTGASASGAQVQVCDGTDWLGLSEGGGGGSFDGQLGDETDVPDEDCDGDDTKGLLRYGSEIQTSGGGAAVRQSSTYHEDFDGYGGYGEVFFPQQALPGSMIFVVVSGWHSNSNPFIVPASEIYDDVGGTYSLAVAATDDIGNYTTSTYIFYRYVTSTANAPTMVGFYPTTAGELHANYGYGAIEVTGLANLGPETTGTAHEPGAATSTVTASAPTSEGGEFAIASLFSWNTPTPGDGWTGFTNQPGLFAYKVLGGVETASHTWSHAATSTKSAIATFRPAKPAVVQTKAVAEASGDTVSNTFTTPPVAGNTVIAFVRGNSDSSSDSIFTMETLTDNRGNTYHQVGVGGDGYENYPPGNYGTRVYIYAAYNVTSGAPFTVTAKSVGTNYGIHLGLMEVSGVSSVGSAASYGCNHPDSCIYDTSTILGLATTADNSIVVGLHGYNANYAAGYSTSPGWTILENDDWYSIVYRSVPAKGSVSHTWNHNAVNYGAISAVMVSLNGASSTVNHFVQACNGKEWVNVKGSTGAEEFDDLSDAMYDGSNLALGANAMGSWSGTSGTNVAVGSGALQYGGGWESVAVGSQAMPNNSGGVSVAVGANTVSASNCAACIGIGDHALGSWSGGALSDHIAVGYQAFWTLNTGTGGVAAGYGAAHGATVGGGGAGSVSIGAYSNHERPGVGGTAIGYSAMRNTGADNTAFGYEALRGTAPQWAPVRSVAFGDRALTAVTEGENNTAFGARALDAQATGDGSVAVGANALTANAAAWGHTAVGLDAAAAGNNISPVTAFGYRSSASQTSEGYNVTIGDRTAQNVTGYGGNIVGARALGSGTGTFHTAIGVEALYNVTESYNTAMGYRAAYGCRGSGCFWSGAFGSQAADANSPDSFCAVGADAMAVNTGSYNSAFGRYAMQYATTGNYNTAVGYNAGPAAASPTIGNSTAVGYNAEVTASNRIRLGNTAVTSIGGRVPWTATSDGRVKKDIAESDLGQDFIDRLKPVSYRLIEGNGRLDYGFIAQDVEEALEGRVTNMITRQEDERKTYQLRAADIIAPVVKTIQEQQDKIRYLKEEIGKLEKEDAALCKEKGGADEKR